METAEEITIEADEEVVSEEAAYSGLVNTTVNSKVMTNGRNLKRGAYIYMGTKSADYIWTDERPTWIVLDPNKTNNGDTGIFLLSKELIGKKGDTEYRGIQFNSGYETTNANAFQGSNAQAWCKTFLGKVFPREKGAIMPTTKSDAEFRTDYLNPDGSVKNTYIYSKSENILNKDKIFFLSAEEVLNPSYGFSDKNYMGGVYTDRTADFKTKGNTGAWWLRSPCTKVYSGQKTAGAVDSLGMVTWDILYTYSGNYARPAFNLNWAGIEFVSAAAGGKASGPLGASCLKQIAIDDVSEWKLTLRDYGNAEIGNAHADFKAERISFDGSTLKFSYSGAGTGPSEYVSAIVSGSNSNLIKLNYYGRVVQNSASGTATIDLSGKYEPGDRLWVFAEQYNGDYETDYCSRLFELSLDVPVTGVTLNKTTASVGVGSTEQLTATVAPAKATNKYVTWSSSDTSVATVNGAGLVMGKKAGTATITVKTEDGNRTATCKVTVEDSNVPVTGVTLNRTTMSVTKGSTGQLTATVAPSNATNTNVTWSSSDTSVATVSSSGLVTGVKAGIATITVKTADGGKTATCKVTVTVTARSVKLDKTEMTLEVGKTGQLTATVLPEDAKNKSVAWSSSDTSVATVSSSGLVTAKKAGTAKIRATKSITISTGKKALLMATCTVTVTAASGGETKTGTWKKDSKGWWYQRADGSYPKSQWEKIGGKWYHFDAKGYMQTGWFKEGGKWYYLDSSGAMVTGWKKISGKWYYFNSSGVMQTGWQKISGKWYYFESSGAMLANTSKKIGKKTYHFDKNGVCTNP